MSEGVRERKRAIIFSWIVVYMLVRRRSIKESRMAVGEWVEKKMSWEWRA